MAIPYIRNSNALGIKGKRKKSKAKIVVLRLNKKRKADCPQFFSAYFWVPIMDGGCAKMTVFGDRR